MEELTKGIEPLDEDDPNQIELNCPFSQRIE
jgi:hypothetical protein